MEGFGGIFFFFFSLVTAKICFQICECDAVIADFPPAFMLLCHSRFFKDGTRVSLLTWFLEDIFFSILGPIFTILHLFRNTEWIWRQWSPPVRWDHTFHRTRIGQRKKIRVCFSAELFSGLTDFLSCVGFVKSPSEISIDYHGNCTGPVVAIVMPDGEKLCMWVPQRIAHWILNSDECTGSKRNRTEHKCRQGTTSLQYKTC